MAPVLYPIPARSLHTRPHPPPSRNTPAVPAAKELLSAAAIAHTLMLQALMPALGVFRQNDQSEAALLLLLDTLLITAAHVWRRQHPAPAAGAGCV